MSTIVAAEVKRRLNVSGGLYTLALELADTANHNGESIYKSAALLAKLTRQGDRTIHRQLKKLREVGWLVMIRRKHSAKYPVPLYAISPDWLRGASLATLPDLDLQTCHSEPAELPLETRRLATGGKQSVITHHKGSSRSDVSVKSARARANPAGSRGAGAVKSIRERNLDLAVVHLRANPRIDDAQIVATFDLTAEQLAKARANI